MSALHLKQCVHSYSVFDFLKETVSKVPDLGGSEAGGEDRPKRRKAVDEGNDSEEESKRSRTEAAAGGHGSSSSRGRGRGRGRGRPRKVDREGAAHYDRCEDDPGTSPQHYDRPPQYLKTETLGEGSSNATDEKETTDGNNTGVIRNFDLNMDLDENGDTSAGTASAMASASSKDCDMKQEEYLGWSQSDVDKMTDPLQLALLSKRVEEEEEDYDNEE